MKIIVLAGLLSFAVAGCHFTTGCTGLPPAQKICTFAADTLKSDAPELDLTADSNRTYSYQFAQSNPDSILHSLCAKGIEIFHAYNDADYLCKDMKGPRFVVVLAASDARILSENFLLGNEGRFGCATKVVRYMNVIAVE